MFIPRDTVVHQNLATSYVLVDALVADLCEGGFSGVIEIALRDADCFIVIERGEVILAALLGEQRRERTTVQEIAACSRAERGRVSVYSLSPEAATAIAQRAFAEPAYTRLSTDFADLEKMIAKLRREPDREWFVEVQAGSGISGLINIKNDQCKAFTSGQSTDCSEAALRHLLDECAQAGGTFDVYFSRVGEEVRRAASPPNEQPHIALNQAVAQPESDSSGTANQLVATHQYARALNQAEAMAEAKRLMAEIANAIEQAAREIEPRDAFSIYLRAGQLKLADRYPFLDPFGSDFEYLAGEIVFVGRASLDEFVAGVTEALRLAVVGIAQASAQSARLRSRIIEALSDLLESRRSEFEAFRLDKSIEQIISY
jgi:hypothetical protein